MSYCDFDPQPGDDAAPRSLLAATVSAFLLGAAIVAVLVGLPWALLAVARNLP